MGFSFLFLPKILTFDSSTKNLNDFNSNDFEGKNKIIERIAENSYFIPDLNYNLTQEEWTWTHSIWRIAQDYIIHNNIGLDNSFKENVSELLKKSTKIGRYRIESLNSQYGIIL